MPEIFSPGRSMVRPGQIDLKYSVRPDRIIQDKASKVGCTKGVLGKLQLNEPPKVGYVVCCINFAKIV